MLTGILFKKPIIAKLRFFIFLNFSGFIFEFYEVGYRWISGFVDERFVKLSVIYYLGRFVIVF
jgi:hypothetical protein